ncbi:MAG: hypothetical protein AAGF09_06910, partial [Pseudomonadota bacterium]
MKKIAQIAAAGVVAISVAGCSVEVPMSAFRVGPIGAEQQTGAEQHTGAQHVPAPQAQSENNRPAGQ